MSQPIPGSLIYEAGGSSTGPREFFANFPVDAGANPDYIFFFDDFNAGKALDGTNDYDTSVKDAGATAAALTLDVLGGAARILSTATTVNDGGLLQCTNQTLMLQSNKKMWFEARVRGSSVADQEMFVGLCKQVATNPEDILATGFARVGFTLNSSSAVIKSSMGDGTNTSSTSLGVSMSDATFVKLGFYFDGASSLSFYVDRAKKLTVAGGWPIVGTDLLSPAFESRSISGAGTRTGDIDYFLIVCER